MLQTVDPEIGFFHIISVFVYKWQISSKITLLLFATVLCIIILYALI